MTYVPVDPDIIAEKVWQYANRKLTPFAPLERLRIGLTGVSDYNFTSDGNFEQIAVCYNNLTIASGVTVTLPPSAKTQFIFVKNVLTLDGVITTVGRGGAGGTHAADSAHPGESGVVHGMTITGGAGGEGWAQGGGGGAGTWGNGGKGRGGHVGGTNPKSVIVGRAVSLRHFLVAEHYGAGGGGGTSGNYSGGDGGNGGGSVIIVANEIRGSGQINVSGEDAHGDTRSSGGGGGGAGLIYICAKYVDGISLIANGGKGGPGTIDDGHGGGGGGGLIIVISPEDHSSKSVSGGAAGGSNGEPGENGIIITIDEDPFTSELW